MASYNFGFNFRATQGYVTDPANTVGFFGNAYPTSKTFGATNVNAGWDGAVSVADRSTTIDPRLAGGNTVAQNGSARKFRVDLPVSGVWTIRLAMGNPSFSRAASFDILDSDGTTVLYSRSEVTVPAPQYLDATKVVRAAAATWVSSNASVDLTFSGTAAYIRLNPSTTLGNEICHIAFTKNTSPQATIADVDVFSTVGTATVTVSLDVIAPSGGCSVDYSTQNVTAIAGTNYIAGSGTLTFLQGEQTKQIQLTIIP